VQFRSIVISLGIGNVAGIRQLRVTIPAFPSADLLTNGATTRRR
jgi:hypothetical protein